jgi:hypothetical protein
MSFDVDIILSDISSIAPELAKTPTPNTDKATKADMIPTRAIYCNAEFFFFIFRQIDINETRDTISIINVMTELIT